MADKPFGIDVSYWQGQIDWNRVAVQQPKVEFVGIRAGISWGYTDKWFARNWSEAKRVGILRMAYHVLYPGEDPKKQMDHFLQIVGDDIGELPLVLDCELTHNQTKEAITRAIVACSDILLVRTGRKPIVYSRAQWINDYTMTGSWRNEHYWWLAHYLNSHTQEHPGPPAMPKGVERDHVLIHQTGTIIVSNFGVASKELDFDRWQFDQAHLRQYAGQGSVVEPTDKVKLDCLWAAHPELH